MNARKYQNAQEAWIKLYDIKVGDILKISRKPNPQEYNFHGWDDNMDDNIGNEEIVDSIEDGGILMGDGYYYPFYVLEYISSSNSVVISDDYTAIIKDNGNVRVGCQRIPYAMLQRIYDIATINHNNYGKRKAPTGNTTYNEEDYNWVDVYLNDGDVESEISEMINDGYTLLGPEQYARAGTMFNDMSSVMELVDEWSEFFGKKAKNIPFPVFKKS